MSAERVLYGIPYMGSKTKIAPLILKRLPKGRRFIDLFGGGFAMSHCAFLSHRFGQVVYNDYNPLIVDLIQRGLNGEFNYTRFKPEFITREMFNSRKDTDGYVKYIWSFGNDGNHYMFGKDVEPLKHSAHDFVVFGKWDGRLDETFRKAVKSSDIHQRRLEFCGYARAAKKRFDLQRLQQLEQLERLQQLERFIVCTNKSYTDYEYQDGDVVYCDPPYEGTSEYDESFDHAAFYEWAATRVFPVWFSSYQISDKRFTTLYAKQLGTTRGSSLKRKYNFECLYANGEAVKIAR